MSSDGRSSRWSRNSTRLELDRQALGCHKPQRRSESTPAGPRGMGGTQVVEGVRVAIRPEMHGEVPSRASPEVALCQVYHKVQRKKPS